jgi:hypothetical protein
MKKPTVSYEEFMDQVNNAHEELCVLVLTIKNETLPVEVMNVFSEEDIEPIEAALKILDEIINT